jgi:hypothetical protein
LKRFGEFEKIGPPAAESPNNKKVLDRAGVSMKHCDNDGARRDLGMAIEKRASA